MFRLLLIVPMLLLPSLALADNPAMGPYGSSVVWGPEMSFLPSRVARLCENVPSGTPPCPPLTQRTDLVHDIAFSPSAPAYTFRSSWEQAMQAAGICVIHFKGDGSGIRIGIRVPNGCEIGPVISFPEFRQRMEEPQQDQEFPQGIKAPLNLVYIDCHKHRPQGQEAP